MECRRSATICRSARGVRTEAAAFPGLVPRRPSGIPGDGAACVGHQLDRVQRGLDPNDWKPVPSIGRGVREVRVRDQSGAFRAIYLTARPEAVYVRHAFQKKTQATAKRDLDLAETRLRELIRRMP